MERVHSQKGVGQGCGLEEYKDACPRARGMLEGHQLQCGQGKLKWGACLPLKGLNPMTPTEARVKSSKKLKGIRQLARRGIENLHR
jgi:hypothetical protein